MCLAMFRARKNEGMKTQKQHSNLFFCENRKNHLFDEKGEIAQKNEDFSNRRVCSTPNIV